MASTRFVTQRGQLISIAAPNSDELDVIVTSHVAGNGLEILSSSNTSEVVNQLFTGAQGLSMQPRLIHPFAHDVLAMASMRSSVPMLSTNNSSSS